MLQARVAVLVAIGVLAQVCTAVPQARTTDDVALVAVVHTVAHHQNCSHLSNCHNHGSCVNGTCHCSQGYGRRLLGAPHDCAEWLLDDCPSRCSGNGNCVIGSPNSTCACFAGFSGDICDVWDGCAQLGFCSGHGSCLHSQSSPTTHCQCDDTHTGADCSTPTNPCPNNCSGKGTCTLHSPANRSCVCMAGFTGADCSTAESNHCAGNCNGQGSCDASSGTCECVGGATGDACGEASHSCGVSCGHGKCVNNQCKCTASFDGTHCDHYSISSDPQCASLNFCSGFGLCHHTQSHNGTTTASCVCFEGFEGETCSLVAASVTCPSYCSGHGRCVLSSTPHCECDHGWTGVACAESPCAFGVNGKLCSNHGVCDETNGKLACVCDDGWINSAFQKSCDVSACLNGCHGNGQCHTNGSCSCHQGFAGSSCNHTTQATTVTVLSPTPSPPAGTPGCPSDCSGNGACIGSQCECVDGFSSTDCSVAPVDAAPPSSDGLDAFELLTLQLN